MKVLFLIFIFGFSQNKVFATNSSVTPTSYNLVHHYIVSEYQMIHRDVRAKKLNSVQEKALLAQIKAVRQQVDGFVKANGSKILTDDQAVTIQQQLENISKSIPR